jgi:hypothetical protein
VSGDSRSKSGGESGTLSEAELRRVLERASKDDVVRAITELLNLTHRLPEPWGGWAWDALMAVQDRRFLAEIAWRRWLLERCPAGSRRWFMAR